MHKAKTLFAVVLMAFATVASATDISVGPFRVRLALQFGGPTSATPDANSETVAYSSGGRPGHPPTIIQFTRHTVGAAPPNADDALYAQWANSYLQQMLNEIERRSTGYVQSPATQIRLVGHVGARATWVGDLQGVPTNGVMYCVIIGTNVWFIHVFGYGEQPERALQSVIAAVEAQP